MKKLILILLLIPSINFAQYNQQYYTKIKPICKKEAITGIAILGATFVVNHLLILNKSKIDHIVLRTNQVYVIGMSINFGSILYFENKKKRLFKH